MIRKVKILKEGCPQTIRRLKKKSPDIQEEYYDETEGLHSDHDEDEISEEEFEEWTRAIMEYLRKSTTSVRRTCESLERKVT